MNKIHKHNSSHTDLDGEHGHEEHCCCGHEHHHHEDHHAHDESCSCGHEHPHHEHDEDCGCGHEHYHEHEHHADSEHENHCCCGHDHHEGHHHGEHHHHSPAAHSQVFILENLGCANCAAKMERHINELPGVEEAAITFATRQLRLSAEDPENLLPQIQEICSSIESEVRVVPKRTSSGARTKIYILQGLDCANCAAKIEKKLQTLDGVEDVSITFATLQMRLTAKNPDALIPAIQATIDSLEEGITISPKESGSQKETSEKKSSRFTEAQRDLISIAAGAVFFLIGIILEHSSAPAPAPLVVFLLAYLILGGEVLLTAARNIGKGQIFDENFLMCIATIGAFAIQDYPEAVVVMLFYRIGEYFEDRAMAQSRAQIMDAVDLRPEVVHLVNGDEVKVLAAEDAAVGDILLVRPGDRIPLDGIIVEGESRIDTSPVTGEPVPVTAAVGDSVISGCVNTSGQLKIRVEKVLAESMVTRILNAVENAAASKPAIDKFITRFARIYTPAVVLAALLVAFALPVILPDWHFFVDSGFTGANGIIYGTSGTASIFTALTFLVISCPCALVLSVPLAFFSGIGSASRKGILFKGGNVIEALSGIQAVVMDKTGTITKGNFVVQKAVSASDQLSEKNLLTIAAGCEKNSTHPIAHSILRAAEERKLTPETPSELKEIAGYGIKAILSCGTVLCGNRKLMEAEQIDMSQYHADPFGTEVFLAINGEYAGHVVIADTIKEDAAEAIARTRRYGITTAMLTGDAQESAEAVARQSGIDEVHARLLPEDKLEELKKIRQTHGSVMFVGDGINDAPVLAGADVGAAMGSGADAAIEAADVVFMTSEMMAIPQAIEIAKATKRVSWQNVYFALGIKLLVMILGLAGHASMWLAVFADTGVSMLCLLNSFRILKKK